MILCALKYREFFCRKPEVAAEGSLDVRARRGVAALLAEQGWCEEDRHGRVDRPDR